MRRDERPTWSFNDKCYPLRSRKWERTVQNGNWTVAESVGGIVLAYARKIKRGAK
jgi:hypothetical protein